MSHVTKAKTLKIDQMPRRYRNHRKKLSLARSDTLSSIIMRFCWSPIAIHLSLLERFPGVHYCVIVGVLSPIAFHLLLVAK
ncbi:hypothetical protein ARALYDRAFT_907840 [Arabidopsis lyrata subsp. lyrata]|uniref:Uncharacterized protein n=1 Tax=Arabidopsis lyrata subsp. lyrata TaxID=81972 RepID=D7LT83_ARALL|nr:hypothetical protein ARALYDRAFT_907840 [Arabidopsis lyrata subsp. lyrata]